MNDEILIVFNLPNFRTSTQTTVLLKKDFAPWRYLLLSSRVL